MINSTKGAKDMEKKKFRFNIVDVILLLIIAAASAALGYIFLSGSGSEKSDTVEIVYTVDVPELRRELKNKIEPGDRVVDSVSLCDLGEVVSVEYLDQIYEGEDHKTGTLVYSVHPGEMMLRLTVKATASKADGFYMINGYYMAVGVTVSFRTPGFMSNGPCMSVEEVSA